MGGVVVTPHWVKIFRHFSKAYLSLADSGFLNRNLHYCSAIHWASIVYVIRELRPPITPTLARGCCAPLEPLACCPRAERSDATPTGVIRNAQIFAVANSLWRATPLTGLALLCGRRGRGGQLFHSIPTTATKSASEATKWRSVALLTIRYVFFR